LKELPTLRASLNSEAKIKWAPQTDIPTSGAVLAVASKTKKGKSGGKGGERKREGEGKTAKSCSGGRAEGKSEKKNPKGGSRDGEMRKPWISLLVRRWPGQQNALVRTNEPERRTTKGEPKQGHRGRVVGEEGPELNKGKHAKTGVLPKLRGGGLGLPTFRRGREKREGDATL